MENLKYLPSEIHARFTAWANARPDDSTGCGSIRDELWGKYVDARDGLAPGTTLALMQNGVPVKQPPASLLSRRTPGHIFQ